MQKGNEMHIRVPFIDYLLKNTLALLYKIFIILLLYNLI